MYKIIHKENKGNDEFDIEQLSNEFNFKKLAVSAMMTLGKEKIKKISSSYKKKLEKKEGLELLYDKKTESIAIVIAKKKKPIKVLEVWEINEINGGK